MKHEKQQQTQQGTDRGTKNQSESDPNRTAGTMQGGDTERAFASSPDTGADRNKK